MKIRTKFYQSAVLILTLVLFPMVLMSASSNPVTLTIHLRGVYESKVTLMTTMTATNLIQPILTEEGVMNGGSCTFTVPVEYLPGEFVLRFDYKEDASSDPYPSEKNFVISRQDLELWVQPVYSNNSDSTWFQKDETENAAFGEFMKENYAQKEMLGLLQNFLMNYDDAGSDFYLEGVTEYEKRRAVHNNWIREQIKTDRKLFVASLYNFQFVPEVKWVGSEHDRRQSFKDHYFDNIDFNDSLLTRTRDLKSWMDQYVNLYGEDVTTTEMRDSLFTLAGKISIEKAKTGHPKVYGWMVDYFYKGYESFNIGPGIAMLAPYLDDPNCLTTKRQAILKRVEGMKTLVPGANAPEIYFNDKSGSPQSMLKFDVISPYKLVLFWSADCPHCMELVNKLYAWWQKPGNRDLLSIFAVSLDETDTEIAEWSREVNLLPGWVHKRTEGGVNSPEAAAYFILATPVMIVVNSKSGEIVAMPENVDQLQEVVR